MTAEAILAFPWPVALRRMAAMARDGGERDVDSDEAFIASDEDLAERVRTSGDTAAFAQIIARYRGRLVALARRMLLERGGGSDEAEDVAQEALVAAYHRRETYRRGEPFRPWLYRIVVNRCLDRLRAQSRRPTLGAFDDLPEPEASEGDPIHTLLADEWEAELAKAVAALPPRHRAVFLLRHLDDLTYEEIAIATDIPMGTVKTYLFRARAQLRRELTGYLNA